MSFEVNKTTGIIVNLANTTKLTKWNIMPWRNKLGQPPECERLKNIAPWNIPSNPRQLFSRPLKTSLRQFEVVVSQYTKRLIENPMTPYSLLLMMEMRWEFRILDPKFATFTFHFPSSFSLKSKAGHQKFKYSKFCVRTTGISRDIWRIIRPKYRHLKNDPEIDRIRKKKPEGNSKNGRNTGKVLMYSTGGCACD